MWHFYLILLNFQDKFCWTPRDSYNLFFLLIFCCSFCNIAGALNHRLHHGTMADALMDATRACNRQEDHYKECSLANELGLHLRLVGVLPNISTYHTPRIIRFAAFTGMKLMELDAPASHGRQILKYAHRNKLPHIALLTAFADTGSVYKFRESFSGIDKSSIKQIVNRLCYGNSGKDWLKQHSMARLPDALQQLKEEIRGVVNHMVSNVDPAWYNAIRTRQHWQLTLLSIHCQLGERAELEAAAKMLPDGTKLHGWLGDSLLIAPGPGFDTDAFLVKLAGHGIVLTTKPLPSDEEEYFQMFKDITNKDFDRSPLAGRLLRQQEAKRYAWTYLTDPKSMRYIPHLEFAISIEDRLPLVYNPETKQIEFYSAVHGRWFAGGGHDQAKGEVLSDALIQTFVPSQWGYVEVDGRLKVRRVAMKWDDSCFRSNTFLTPIGEAIKNLRLRKDTGLDSNPSVAKVINFEGPYHLDFATPVPSFDWSSDEQLEAAIYMPLQDCVSQRFVSHIKF